MLHFAFMESFKSVLIWQQYTSMNWRFTALHSNFVAYDEVMIIGYLAGFYLFEAPVFQSLKKNGANVPTTGNVAARKEGKSQYCLVHVRKKEIAYSFFAIWLFAIFWHSSSQTFEQTF